MKTLLMNLFIMLFLLCSNNAFSQADEYEQAISLLKEQLKNPDITPEMRTALRNALTESQAILNELNDNRPEIIYTGDAPKINYENTSENERRNNLQGLVSPTPTTTSGSGGTKTSGSAY